MKNIKLRTDDGKIFELEVADYNSDELIFEIKNFKTVFSIPDEKTLDNKIERRVEEAIDRKLNEIKFVEPRIINEGWL